MYIISIVKILSYKETGNFAATSFPGIYFFSDDSTWGHRGDLVYTSRRSPVSSTRLTVTNANRDLLATSSYNTCLRGSASGSARMHLRRMHFRLVACRGRKSAAAFPSHRLHSELAELPPSGERDIRRRINDFECALYASRSRREQFRRALKPEKMFLMFLEHWKVAVIR